MGGGTIGGILGGVAGLALLLAIASSRPADRADLAAVPGVGPAKLERYADQVLSLVNA